MKFSREKLKKEIMQEARAINIQSGAAEMMADRVIDSLEKWAKKRAMVTREDLDVAIAREVKKYSADLAYVYKNRGKII